MLNMINGRVKTVTHDLRVKISFDINLYKRVIDIDLNITKFIDFILYMLAKKLTGGKNLRHMINAHLWFHY